jgi:signal transduction histidine kinase
VLPTRLREVLALLVTGLVLLASAFVWLTQQPEIGFTIVQRPGWVPDTATCSTSDPCGLPNDPRYIVGDVTPGTEVARQGMRPGAAMIGVNGSPPRQPVDTRLERTGTWWPSPPEAARELASADDNTLVLVNLGEMEVRFWYSGVLLLLGVTVLAVVIGGLAGAVSGGLVLPLAAATAMPLLADPLTRWATPLGSTMALLAPALASLLLADALAARIPSLRWRGSALVGALAAAVASVLLPLQVFMAAPIWSRDPALAWMVELLALLLVSLVPALMLVIARKRARAALAPADEPGPRWLTAAACSPAVALIGASVASIDWVPWLLVLIYVTVLVGWRTASRRIAHAGLQRDLVVTVTEAERARLAADLHDVALQELTLLVRRLDTTGDPAGAQIARTVAEHLRELCGQLHLPILDELGAGPALDWLVQQIATTTGEEVVLELADPDRPPAAVELAVFRVAQEAISNAVKHGTPPIMVRYATSSSTAFLSVDDAGPRGDAEPGWRPGRSPIAPRPGHYGVVSMQQRAEQIGALLAIRSWPSGGTRVSLEWKTP